MPIPPGGLLSSLLHEIANNNVVLILSNTQPINAAIIIPEEGAKRGSNEANRILKLLAYVFQRSQPPRTLSRSHSSLTYSLGIPSFCEPGLSTRQEDFSILVVHQINTFCAQYGQPLRKKKQSSSYPPAPPVPMAWI